MIDVNNRSTGKANLFLNLNGIPYVGGEYIENVKFQTIDWSTIHNQLMIDNTGTQASVVDIVLDNAGDSPIGNREAYRKLLDSVARHAKGGFIDVVRPTLVAVLDYQIESEKTGQLLKKAKVDIPLNHRGYYVNVSSGELGDNTFIVNSTDSITRTITERPYGNDRVIVRLTGINLHYVGLLRPAMDPGKGPKGSEDYPTFRPDDNARYPHMDWHESAQPKHSFEPIPYTYNWSKDPHHDQLRVPPNWWACNRYYHFEDRGSNLVLHLGDIKSLVATYRIPVGKVAFNRVFSVGQGYKVLFRVSVWSNDAVIITNTAKIAQLMGLPGSHPEHQPESDILRMIFSAIKRIDRKNASLDHKIQLLVDRVSKLNPCDDCDLDEDDDIDYCPICGAPNCDCLDEEIPDDHEIPTIYCSRCGMEIPCDCDLLTPLCPECGMDPCECEDIEPAT